MVSNGYLEKSIKAFDDYVKDGYFCKEKHPEDDIYIYGYTSGPFSAKNLVWNNVTRMMRGLIVNGEGQIISKSFDKFFTFKGYLSDNMVQLTDGQVAKLPNLPYKVYEKLDGSLTVLYWVNDKPYLASQRSFTSSKAKKATEILYKKYQHTFKNLRKDRSYIFEAIYKESKVLIDYPFDEELILLGIIDNNTGKDLPLEDLGFPIAKDWTNDLVNIKNFNDMLSLNIENLEGFVIVYENGFRIKLKFPWYLEAHKMLNKIIEYEYYIDYYERNLRNIKGMPSNRPSYDKILQRFENGESPKEILHDFPKIYKYIGITDFLENEYKKYKGDSFSEDESNLSYMKEILEKDRFYYDSTSENIVWNMWNGLAKKYDW